VIQDRFSFDPEAAETAKQDGMNLAADNRQDLLELAKAAAVAIASETGVVTSDDVFRRMQEYGLNPILLGNAAGSVFRGNEFVFTGQWRKSERASNHARVNRVWALRLRRA
jgi:hypothetical protein